LIMCGVIAGEQDGVAGEPGFDGVEGDFGFSLGGARAGGEKSVGAVGGELRGGERSALFEGGEFGVGGFWAIPAEFAVVGPVGLGRQRVGLRGNCLLGGFGSGLAGFALGGAADVAWGHSAER